MSELQYYLRPRPAYEPVRTKGNVFWRNGDRVCFDGKVLAEWRTLITDTVPNQGHQLLQTTAESPR